MAHGKTVAEARVERYLKGVPKDRKIRIPGLESAPATVRVTDAGLKYLRGLTNLQYLDLRCNPITDAGLAYLSELVNLGTLNLSDTHITDAGLEHLKTLTKLQDLLLHNTRITDSGLQHLKALKNLQSLDVSSTCGPVGDMQITDAGLKHLEALPNLWNLELWGTQVSREGVNRLHEALPRCRIFCPYGEFRGRIPLHREHIPGTLYWRFVPAQE